MRGEKCTPTLTQNTRTPVAGANRLWIHLNFIKVNLIHAESLLRASTPNRSVAGPELAVQDAAIGLINNGSAAQFLEILFEPGCDITKKEGSVKQGEKMGTKVKEANE